MTYFDYGSADDEPAPVAQCTRLCRMHRTARRAANIERTDAQLHGVVPGRGHRAIDTLRLRGVVHTAIGPTRQARALGAATRAHALLSGSARRVHRSAQ